MRKILSVALVTLAACGSSAEKQQRPITYGAPVAPTYTEISAIQGAEATLQSNVTFVTPTEPATGGPGLADQLVGALGGYGAGGPDGSTAKLTGSATRQAFSTGGMDPTCVITRTVNGVTTVTWGASTPCRVDYADATTSMTVIVSGSLTWTPGSTVGTGTSAWGIHEDYSMTTTSGAQQMSVTGDADLTGSMRIGADTIGIDSRSLMTVQASQPGMPSVAETIDTTLAGTVGYVTSPAFCITSGSLDLVQRVTMASIEQSQAWQFTWHGCGAFEVAHGS